MELTDSIKAQIDSYSYEELLRQWRNAPIGSQVFSGESGKYWSERMAQLRNNPGGDERHVRASKNIGWEG